MKAKLAFAPVMGRKWLPPNLNVQASNGRIQVSCGQDSETPSNAPASVDAFSYTGNPDFVPHGGTYTAVPGNGKFFNSQSCDAIPAQRDDHSLFAYAGSTAHGPAEGTCVRGSLASFKMDGGKKSCDWCGQPYSWTECTEEVKGGTTSSCCSPVTMMQSFKHDDKTPEEDDGACFRVAVGETQACNSNFDLLIYQCSDTSSAHCNNADGNLEIFKIYSRHSLTSTSSARPGCRAWFAQADTGVRDLVGQLRATIMADASEELKLLRK
jgi:hypothetical protein